MPAPVNIIKRILYEDNHLVVVNKMPSEIVQGDKTGDEPLCETLKKYLKEKYKKPGDVFIGVVHRLDRPVSGVVLFARTSKALARMNTLVREREIRKTYWAIVRDLPPEEAGTIISYMKKNEEKNRSLIYDYPADGLRRAELRYRLLAGSDNFHLLEVELLTGRHHQIRAQLAHIGCPIRGDTKYGFPRPNPDASVSLHARSVSFVHPVKKEELTIIARPPDDPLWNFFATHCK